MKRGGSPEIVGDLKYKNPPSWTKPDTNPDNTVKKNSTSVTFNWDSRLGSRSPDGMDFFIYLPMSIANPRVVSWREVI